MLTAWLLELSGPAQVLATALLALALDALFGDPAWLYRVVPHAVAALGRLIDRAEARLNRLTLHPKARRRRGLALTAAVTFLALALGLLLTAAFARVPGGWIAEAVVAGMLLAGRGLYDHVAAVARGLARSLPEGRAAVAHVVGRDPDSLDRAAVARAAIESAAENFSDGVVAPLLFYLAFGLPGLFVYKAVNTLDSMIGHRSPRYADFGRVAARLDDGVNLLPARLAGGLLVAAALVLPSASAGRAWRTMLRDAPRHHSPNAGWQEAAVAGALGFALAGPRSYPGETVDDAWMGDGRADLGPGDIRAALSLCVVAGGLAAAGVAVAWLLL